MRKAFVLTGIVALLLLGPAEPSDAASGETPIRALDSAAALSVHAQEPPRGSGDGTWPASTMSTQRIYLPWSLREMAREDLARPQPGPAGDPDDAIETWIGYGTPLGNVLEGQYSDHLALDPSLNRVLVATGSEVLAWDTTLGTVSTLAAGAYSAVAVGPDGSYWFGGADDELLRRKPDGSWQVRAGNPDVWAMAFDTEGGLWFGSGSTLVHLDASDREQRWDLGQSGNVRDILVTENGHIYLAHDLGIAELEIAEDGEPRLIDQLESGVAIISAVRGADGRLWFGSRGAGAGYLDRDGQEQRFSRENSGLPSDFVYDIAPLDDGTVWFATRLGLTRWHPDGQWAVFDSHHGLTHDLVVSLRVDATGGIWFASPGGLGWLSPEAASAAPRSDSAQPWRAADAPLRQRRIMSVKFDAQDRMWTAAGSLPGLQRRDVDGAWDYLGMPLEADDWAWSLDFGADGATWAGWSSGAVTRVAADDTVRILGPEDGLTGATVNEVAVDPQGEVWLASDDGVQVVDPHSMRARRFSATSGGSLYLWFADGTVATVQVEPPATEGGAPSLGPVVPRHRYQLPDQAGQRNIAGLALNQHNRLYVWYDDGLRSQGRTDRLDSLRVEQGYGLPADGPGRTYRDIVAITIDGAGGDRVKAWYRDGTRSIGNSSDLGSRSSGERYRTPEGYGPEQIRAIANGNDGTLYTFYADGSVGLGTESSLDLSALEDPAPLQLPESLRGVEIVAATIPQPQPTRNIAFDLQGGTWITSWDYGAIRIGSDGVLQSITTADGLRSDALWPVTVAPDGRIWIGAKRGDDLYVFDTDGRLLDRYDANNSGGALAAGLRALRFDARGRLWIGMVSRLARFHPGAGDWRAWWGESLPETNSIVDLAGSRTGAMWLATERGLFQIRSQEVDETCNMALDLSDSEFVQSRIDDPEDIDVFSLRLDDSFSRIDVVVPDSDNQLELDLYRCEDDGPANVGVAGRHIGIAGRHIGGGGWDGFGQRLIHHVGSRTGRFALVVRAREEAGVEDLDYRVFFSQVEDIPLASTRSLILTHLPRMHLLFGADRAAELEAGLRALAVRPDVEGLLVTDLLSEPVPEPVRLAYSSWMQSRPSNSAWAAGDLNAALGAWIRDLQASELPQLRYVVLVGDDRILPHARLRIQAPEGQGDGWLSESQYMADGLLSPRSAIGAALSSDFTLSDDLVAASDSVPWASGSDAHSRRNDPLPLPRLAVGRLVETPDDILGAIRAFTQTQGSSVLRQSLSIGYDFMADGPSVSDDHLARLTGLAASVRQRLIGTAFGSSAWARALLESPWDLAIFAAHSQHQRLMAPDGEFLHAEAVLTASTPLDGRMVYGLACHGGLNVPGLDAEGEAHAEPLDLPEAWLRRGATYVGSTGWAYGFDFEGAPQYQELLMSELTRQLVAGGGSSIGEALVAAKREYFWNTSELNHFHAKTLAGTLLYGLPMFRMQAPQAEPEGESAPTTPPERWDLGPLELVQEGLGRRGIRVAVPEAAWQLRGDARGQWFEIEGRPAQPEAGQPLHPRLGRWLDVAYLRAGDPTKSPPKGLVWLGGRYRDFQDFPALVVAAGQLGQRGLRRSQVHEATWQPRLPVRLRSLAVGPDLLAGASTESQSQFVLGQFRARSDGDRTGLMRRYESIEVEVFYSRLEDQSPPELHEISMHPDGERALLTLRASDDSGIAAAYATWTAGAESDATGSWQSTPFEREGDRWRAELPANIELLVQVVDGAGNVARGDADGTVPGSP